MLLAVTTTLTEMFWHTTTFQKECHIMCLTVDTIDRNQHTLTLNQNCIDVQWLMNSHLSQCDTVLYKWNIVIRQSKNGHCLRKVSIQSKLLLINSENRIDISVHKSENSNVSVVQDEGPTSCQLWDTYLTLTWWWLLLLLLLLNLSYKSQCWNVSIKKDFTYKRWQWRSWRRKKKRFEKRGEKVYNSLHWGISWSELSPELYKKENHMSASNKNFICKSYSYKESKHVLTDNDNCTTTFSDT